MRIKQVKLIVRGPLNNKVAVIKAIRTLTGLGLLEAKNASEASGEQFLNILPTLNDATIDEEIRKLRNEGVILADPIHGILDDLRRLASDALVQGEDELANEILQLVLVEKLRRKNDFT